ncbi:MAG: caspase family protein [Myxococcaceae bacterium]
MRWLVLISLLLQGSASAAVRFALIMGSNLGGADDRPLSWAEEDARRVRQLLLELAGVDPRRAELLLGPGDPQRLDLALAHLRGQVEEARRHGERTEVFVYYSGHGDQESLHLGFSRVELSALQQSLTALPADVVVTVVDACRSSKVRSGAARGVQRAPAFDIRYARQTGPRGRVLIHSAGTDEVAQESDDLQGGFFTHQLLTGMRGAADADGDKLITLAEAYRYAFHRTVTTSFGTSAAVQHPAQEINLQGEGELALTTLKRATSTLLLPRGLAGELMIIDDASARVIAELRLSGSEQIELALPAARYRLIRREGGKVYAGAIALHWSKAKTVDADALVEQPRVAALQRGAKWDPTPWRIYIGALAARPRSLGGGVSFGAQMNLERRFEWPLFGILRISGGTAALTESLREVRHSELSIGLGVGVAHAFGPLRVGAGLTVEGVGTASSAQRHDAGRLRAIGMDGAPSNGWTVGPGTALELSLALSLARGLELRCGAGASLTWLKVDQTVRNSLVPLGHAGLGYGF